MSKKIYIAADILIGVMLVIGFITTGSYGIYDNNLASYNNAMDMQSYVDTLGFSDFRLEDYPVAFFQNGKDYVCYEGEVTVREPVLGALVGTAYLVGDRYEVFVPDIRDMAAITGSTAFQQRDRMGAQVSTIWHEAFHAWQMSMHPEQIARRTAGIDFSAAEGSSAAGEILKATDDNKSYRAWLSREIDLLKKAVSADMGSDERAEYLALWRGHQNGLYELGLEDVQLRLIEYYQMIEGSAFYIEKKVHLEYAGEIAYNGYYSEESSADTNGTMKYYQWGMLQCMLLDELTPGWQAGFDLSQSLTACLLDAMEG